MELQKNWSAIRDEQLENLSLKICRLILASSEWKTAGHILSYLSFGKEISLDSLVPEAEQAGKKLYIPLIKGKKITFHRVMDLNQDRLAVNRWGIREPSGRAEHFDLKECGKTLILVPGLGFTKQGVRMGRGGGYYDRFLEEAEGFPDITTMGISWTETLRQNLPAEAHDRRVQCVCVESEIIKCQGLN